MTLEQLQDRTHYLLSQDPAATTNYVTDAQLTLFANEGVDALCLLGKVWECQANITLVSGTAYYAYPTTDSITSATCTVADVFDVAYNLTGESLTFMNPKDKGKIFVSGTVPLWWYLFGNRVWIHPTPGTTEASNTCTVSFYGVPSTALSGASDSPPFPSKYHHHLISYMVSRGKQVFRQFEEAGAFLQEFATLSGIDVAELKRRVGQP